MMLTEWGKQLDKSCPLSEYPRPQFVRDSYLSLNGMWQCAFTRDSTVPVQMDTAICVPFSPETPLSGVERTLKPGEYLHYRRTFALPENFNRGRVFLHFGAVDQMCTVYLNGVQVGGHQGGYTPFTLELTEALQPGENKLEVSVQDFTDENQYSRGKQKTKRGGIWYSPQSGIWQSVWLESTPVEFLEKVRITPNYDGAAVHFEFFGTDHVRTRIYDGETLVADTTDTDVPLPDFKSWSPESPFLYQVEFEACGEVIRSYFGMRKFSVGRDLDGLPRLFLNNKPYFHNGLLDQGYYPDGFLTPPANAAMAYDVTHVKRCGFNMLRKHIKMEPLLWYHYCDVQGILVWQDMINGGGRSIQTFLLYLPTVLPFVTTEFRDNCYPLFSRTSKTGREWWKRECRETVHQLYNAPCVSLWVLFNEGWGQFDAREMTEMVRALDLTRQIDHASGWYDQGAGDIKSLHNYFRPLKVKPEERAFAFSEYGGYTYPVQEHLYSEKSFGYRTYQNQAQYQKAMNALAEKIRELTEQGLAAAVYTQLTDVEEESNGILTYDRKVCKWEPQEAKDFCSKE